MSRLTTKLVLSNDEQRKLDSFKLHSNGVATATTRMIYSDDSVARLKDGSEVVLNELFINKIYDNYGSSIKRKFMIGRNQYPRVIVEHFDDVNNIVGTLQGKLQKVSETIKGVLVTSLYSNILLHNPDVIQDIMEHGQDSQYSKVSIGTDFIKNDLTNPILVELSLTNNPAKKSAMILSECTKLTSFYNSEEYQSVTKDIQEAQLMLSESIQQHKILEMKHIVSSILDKQIYLDRMTRADKHLIMSKINYTDDVCHAIDVLCRNLSHKSRIGSVQLFTKSNIGNQHE